MTFDFHDRRPTSRYRIGDRKPSLNDRRAAMRTMSTNKILVGAPAIAAYMFNDRSMGAQVQSLADGAELAHHYRDGVLSTTQSACLRCLGRFYRDIMGQEAMDD